MSNASTEEQDAQPAMGNYTPDPSYFATLTTKCQKYIRGLEAEVVRLRELEQATIELVRANDALGIELNILRGDRTGSVTMPKDSPAAVVADRDTKADKQFWAIARRIAEAAEAEQVQGASG